jgi:uncharacterized membrane protein
MQGKEHGSQQLRSLKNSQSIPLDVWQASHYSEAIVHVSPDNITNWADPAQALVLQGGISLLLHHFVIVVFVLILRCIVIVFGVIFVVIVVVHVNITIAWTSTRHA